VAAAVDELFAQARAGRLLAVVGTAMNAPLFSRASFAASCTNGEVRRLEVVVEHSDALEAVLPRCPRARPRASCASRRR